MWSELPVKTTYPIRLVLSRDLGYWYTYHALNYCAPNQSFYEDFDVIFQSIRRACVGITGKDISFHTLVVWSEISDHGYDNFYVFLRTRNYCFAAADTVDIELDPAVSFAC